MIRLGKETLIQSRASYHKDPVINRRQAVLLVKDVKATQAKLAMQAVQIRFGAQAITSGEYRKRLQLQKRGGQHWVVWFADGDKFGEALAVFTDPVTRIDGFMLVCEWHWTALEHGGHN